MFTSRFVALVLSRILWYCRAQPNACAIQDELPTIDTSLDAIDEEVTATMLLQHQLLLPADLQASRQDRIVPSTVPPKLLILIVSCHKYESNWSDLVAWGEKVHPGGKVILMSGPDTEVQWALDDAFYFDGAMKRLVVNASDAYEALPVRMLMSLHGILNSPELADITHVLKLDDTTILGTYDGSKPDGMNATLIESALSMEPANYLSPEFGYRAYQCDPIPDHYPYNKDSFEWHFKNVVNTSYWYNRKQPCYGNFTYADGEFGYILSRHAMDVLVQQWPLEKMDNLYYNHVYEDMVIGQTLFNQSVALSPVRSLQGMPHYFARLTCPCSAAAPTAACDAFCSSSDKRCCWQACGINPGQCQASIDV